MSEVIFDNYDEAMFEFIFQDKLNLIRLRKPKKNDEGELDYSFPSEAGIIIKTTFVENENGRRFPNKAFYEYDPTSFSGSTNKVDKKAISKVLKDFLLTYIKANNALNDNFQLTEKSIVKKDNSVKYEVKFSDYVSFNIAIGPKDLDVEDVSEFITGLRIDAVNERGGFGSKKGGESSDSWKIEMAKSSRATCKSCGQKIMKETIRIGEPSYYDGHLSYKWNHLTCIRKFDESTPLEGLDELAPEQQEEARSHLFRGQTASAEQSSDKDPKDLLNDLILEFEDADGLTAESDILKHAKERYKLSSKKIKELLTEMEEDGLIYRPDQGKIKSIS